jgi:glutamate--cysteine ligase
MATMDAEDGRWLGRPRTDPRREFARAGPDLEGVTMTRPSQPLLDRPDPLTVDDAAQFVHETALEDAPIGAVGLEVETHLVDLNAAEHRVPWPRLRMAVDRGSGELVRSRVTVEPGGQIELSGQPEPGVLPAVTAMRRDEQRLRLVLAEDDLGLAHLGADPLRPPFRVNPRPRYRAMERHFLGTGRMEPGRTMMCSTAALQVNLQAGPRTSWPDRVARAQRLGPTLVSIAACSRWVAGRDSGWASARQRAWSDLDPGTSGPVTLTGDPASDWVRHAFAAPVIFIATDNSDVVCVARPVPFSAWLSGRVRLGDRLPTIADLAVHLTTLFPPVRLRGYLEIRYLDISAPRWWPAVAAITATLIDDPVAADAASEATEETAGRWLDAARFGLADPDLARSAVRCLGIAADRVPQELRLAVADLVDLVTSKRCPGDLAAERIVEVGPRAHLVEVAHA